MKSFVSAALLRSYSDEAPSDLILANFGGNPGGGGGGGSLIDACEIEREMTRERESVSFQLEC